MKPRIASCRPDESEYEHTGYSDVIERLDGHCAIKVLSDQLYWICELAGSISTEQVDRIHSPYGWTIRQVFEHCTNAERLFGYRMMRIADGSEPILDDWDENVSADSRFGLGHFSKLVTELGDLRKANLGLLTRLAPRVWNASGVVSGKRATLRTIAWVTAGHLHHHFEIVEKRCSVTATRRPPVVD